MIKLVDEDCDDDKLSIYLSGRGQSCRVLDIPVHGHDTDARDSEATVTLLGACHNSKVSARTVEEEIRGFERFD